MLTVTGSSMAPFLVHGRDQILFRKLQGPLRRGDLAFYCRADGSYVMHRVFRVDADGNYYLLGDAQQQVEGPLEPQRIFAMVPRVCRKGKWLDHSSPCWRFFATVWLWLRPVRPQVLHIYGRLSDLWKGGRRDG